MWNKIWNPSNRKVFWLNLVAAICLNFFLEFMERKSVEQLMLFMQERTFVFLYNACIIFLSLSIVFLVKKKYFVFGILSAAWAAVGLVNGIILENRKTPFTAVDLTIVKSTIPILDNYFATWQVALMIVALILGIAGLVVLFLYCPSAKKEFDLRVNGLLVAVFVGLFCIATHFGVGKGLLISRFDNLIAGYQEFGVAYSFCVTALDTGIDRPIDYSIGKVKRIKNKMQKAQKNLPKQEERTPNIIFIQLESFFDVNDVKGIQLSADPLEQIHRIQEETTSGYVTVPVYGAGTINTEFEMITAMNSSYFGTGEYPYRSILHKRTSESMAYWLKEKGYTTSVIHNNNLSFYDRDYVFSNLGFDYFISSENMDITTRNAVGWATDDILERYIFEVLTSTEQKDYIYTISVQGHGDYPEKPVENPEILVDGENWSEDYKNQMTYYVNQTAQMDRFIGQLVERLADYPEETMLVVYGDHLPGLNFENETLKNGSKYKTPYFIWDNFGYNQAQKEKESGNLRAYQMPAKVLKQMGISNGTMNLYHQTMEDSANYKKNMKLVQYDLLYGAGFFREGLPELEPTTLKYCVNNVRVRKIQITGDDAYILGANFTDYSIVTINGVTIPCEKIDSGTLKIAAESIQDDAELIIHQVSKTNASIRLNASMPYQIREEWILHTEER